MTLGVSVATLTRPFGATSPIEGEVMCALHPLHLAPGGRGRLRSSRVRVAARHLHAWRNAALNRESTPPTSLVCFRTRPLPQGQVNPVTDVKSHAIVPRHRNPDLLHGRRCLLGRAR
jgi:hypothetical protein